MLVKAQLKLQRKAVTDLVGDKLATYLTLIQYATFFSAPDTTVSP